MKHMNWTPYVVTEVDCSSKERTAYIGRAAPFRTREGVEIIIMARNADDIEKVVHHFCDGFDKDLVYKATMIASEGVAVDMEKSNAMKTRIDQPADEPVKATLTTEDMPDVVLGDQVPKQPEMPFRDGHPAVQYVTPRAFDVQPDPVDDDPL